MIKKILVNQKLSKELFYKNIKIDNKTKNVFIKKIESIYLLEKFIETDNEEKQKKEVEEILIFEIKLKDEKYISYIEKVLEVIDRKVPYIIIFYFNLEDWEIYKICNKRLSKNYDNTSVLDIYLTKKITSLNKEEFEKSLDLCFSSLNLEITYKKILKLFLNREKSNENIDILIEKEKEITKIENEIRVIEKTIRKEKDPRKQFDMHRREKNLKIKLETFKKD